MSESISIPREKACFYWNDLPSDIPRNDVLVISFDDPYRERKTARFENSTGEPLLLDFLKHQSAESIFIDYLGDNSLMALDPEHYGKVYSAWLSEFQKVEGFVEPTGEPDCKWVTFTGTKDEIETMEGLLCVIGEESLSVSAMRKDPTTKDGWEIFLSHGSAEDARRIGKAIESYLIFDKGFHGGIRCYLPPVVISPAEPF